MKDITKIRRALARLINEAERRAGVPKSEIEAARAALAPSKPRKKSKPFCRYLFATIEESAGEKDFSFDVIKVLPANADLEQAAEDIARNWYEVPDLDEQEQHEKDGDSYLFDGGTISVSVGNWKEVTPTDYAVLRKYIHPLN